MKHFYIAIIAVLLAGCTAKKSPTFYGVKVEGTPFEFMERLVYEASDRCMPTDFLPMADGVYIFATLADGEEIAIFCETDEKHQITNIKLSEQCQ